MCIYTVFFHSSVDEHLGCLQLLAIVNNAAMNFGVQIYVQVPAFNSLDLYLGIKLLCHMVVPTLTFCFNIYFYLFI